MRFLSFHYWSPYMRLDQYSDVNADVSDDDEYKCNNGYAVE